MKKIYVKSNWKGYLAVHETISGFQLFLCNDEEYARTALTIDRMQSLEQSHPRNYKLIYKSRQEADDVLAHIARLNKFSEVLRNP